MNKIIYSYEEEPGLIQQNLGLILQMHLQKAKPGYNVTIKPVVSELALKISQWNNDCDLLTLINNYLGVGASATNCGLLISDSERSKFVKFCLSYIKHAYWGCCIGDFISFDYAPYDKKLATQLHECMHLFGVSECYDVNSLKPLPSCDNAACVMRFGNNATEICNSVHNQLREKLT